MNRSQAIVFSHFTLYSFFGSSWLGGEYVGSAGLVAHAAFRFLYGFQGRALGAHAKPSLGAGAAHSGECHRPRPSLAQPAPIPGTFRQAGGINPAFPPDQRGRSGAGAHGDPVAAFHDGADDRA